MVWLRPLARVGILAVHPEVVLTTTLGGDWVLALVLVLLVVSGVQSIGVGLGSMMRLSTDLSWSRTVGCTACLLIKPCFMIIYSTRGGTAGGTRWVRVGEEAAGEKPAYPR